MKPAAEFGAELLGTFALTFISGAAIMQTRNVDAGASLVDVALAHGFVIALLVSTFMRISGHLNPAVTLGLLAIGRITPTQAGTFIGGQVTGAITAAFSLKALFPAALWEATRGTRPLVSLDVGTGAAFALEAVATGIMMLAFLGTVIDPKGPKLGGLAVGMAAAAGTIAIGPVTGASMNPARTLGPMLATGAYEGLALYIAAPIVGAVVAALAYRSLLLESE